MASRRRPFARIASRKSAFSTRKRQADGDRRTKNKQTMRDCSDLQMEELRYIQHKFSRLWTECQNCIGSMDDAVRCSAQDCPIFYMREKARLDLEEKTAIAERFDYYNNL